MSAPRPHQENRKRVLTLEATADGRTFDFSDQELKMMPPEEPEIRLHFLRLGLFSKAEKSELIAAKAQPLPQNGEPVQKGMHGELYTTEEGATQNLDEVILSTLNLENFGYARTGLKHGYLYIMDEADPDKPVEYEIGEGGRFKSISWEKKTDLRKPDGKLTTNGFHVAEYEAVLWVAYSPVQWSVDFYDRLKNSTADRKVYMAKVACTGFKEGEEEVQGDYMPVDKATAYFSKADTSSARSLASKLDALQCQEQLDKEKHREKRPEQEFIRPDMFITLNDPLNNLLEVSDALAKKTLEFRALIDAIQSGETLDAALRRLENGNDTPPEPDENYASLFSLALTSYLMVYSDDDSKDKYDGGVNGFNNEKEKRTPAYNPYSPSVRGRYNPNADTKLFKGGLDLSKVEGILGCEDRQKLRETVQTYREDYAVFIGSKSCKEHFEYYLHNHPERTLYGCRTLFDTLMAFYPNPYNWDRHLLLKKDHKKQDDLQDWVYGLLDDEQKYAVTLADEQAVNSKAPDFEGIDALYALLTTPIALEKPLEENPFKYSLAVAGVVKAKLQVHSDEVFSTRTAKGKTYTSIKAKHTFVTKKINKKFKLGKDLVKMKGNQMHLNPDVFTKYASIDWEAVSKGKYTGGNKKVLKILKRYDGLVYIGKEGGKHKFEIPYEKSGEKLSKVDVRKNTLNQKASIVLNSRAFNGTIAFLQVLNFKGAFEDMAEKRDINSSINMLGVSAELTEAVLILQKIGYSNLSRKAKGKLLGKIKFAGLMGGSISAGLCFYDALMAFNKRDNDSGLAFMGAAVAFGSALFFSGPVGWIVLGIGVGLLLLADWLTDTDLESYFKNFVLSDAERFPRNSSETPMIFNRRMFNSKENLVGDDYKETLMVPKDAEATLFDLLVCREIHFESLDPDVIEDKRVNTSTPGGSITISKTITSSIKASLIFFHLFNDKNQFSHRIFLFPNGIEDRFNWEITNTQKLENIKSGDVNTGVAVTFDIPQSYRHHLNPASEIIFAAQLQVWNSRFPYPIGKQKNRYLATRLNLVKSHVMFINHTESKNIKILSAEDLLKYQKWKN